MFRARSKKERTMVVRDRARQLPSCSDPPPRCTCGDEYIRDYEEVDFVLIIIDHPSFASHVCQPLPYCTYCTPSAMSDREGRSAPSDDDLSLPRATVAKMIQGTGHLHPIFHFPPPIFFNASHLSVVGVGLHEVTLNSLFPSLPSSDRVVTV